MRLTLRTLLAYLDDILEPSQAKDIGARINENSVASSLVARIRDVTRRRRIGSPELSGPGSTPDSNIIAEYLDNTLEPAAVADVERICLESDTHLAEVAACHEILTIVLPEPVSVQPELRERLYALASPVTGQSRPVAAVIAPAPAAPVVPAYFRRKPWLRTAGPYIILGMLLCAWVWLIVRDKDFLPSALTASHESATGKSPAAAPAQPAATDRAEAPAADSVPDSTVSNAAPDANTSPASDVAAAAPVPATSDAAAPSDQTTASSVVAADVPAQAAANPAEVAAVSDTPAIPPEPPPVGDQPVVPAAPSPVVTYTSPEGILMYRAADSGEWTVLPRNSQIHPGDELACPEPFKAELSVSPPDGQVTVMQLQLSGGTRVRLAPASETSIIELELNRGLLGLVRPSGGAADPLLVGVEVGGERVQFKLLTPGTRCGAMVERPQPDGPPPFVPPLSPTGTLFVVAGAVQVQRADGSSIPADAAPEWVEWTNPHATQFIALRTIPIWLDPDATPTASSRSYARALEPEFALDQPIRNSLPAVLRDRRPQISRLAAEALSLVDDVDDLVLALSAEHEETRLAAIVDLREWSAASEEHAGKLRDKLGRGFRDDERDTVARLLWGISVAEARQEGPANQLLDWMSHANIAIRELAFFQVRKLTGKDLGYRPLNPELQREAAMSRWRDYVRRNKGLIEGARTSVSDGN